MKYQALIFDLDGTVVDSRLDFDQMRTEIGLPDGAPLLESIAEMPPEGKQKAWEVIHRHERMGADQCTLMMGFNPFYRHLQSRGIKTAIITRNSLEIADRSLKKFDLVFERVLSRDCAPAKPSPEGVFQLLKAWEISEQDALFIGDSLQDLQTAQNAKLPFALIEGPNSHHLQAQADYVFSDYHKLGQILGLSQ